MADPEHVRFTYEIQAFYAADFTDVRFTYEIHTLLPNMYVLLTKYKESVPPRGRAAGASWRRSKASHNGNPIASLSGT